MTEHKRDHPRRACGEDVAAYALGALEPVEAERFRRHLATCAVCPDELASFEQVLDDMAISPARHPAPPELKRRVMRAIADEPHLDAAARHERRRPRMRIPRPALTFPAGAAALAAAIVALVLALGSGTATRTVDAQVTGAGTASVRVSGNHGRLILEHFPAAPPGKIYEVWLEHGAGPPKPTTALFGVTRGGAAEVDVPGSLRGVSHILVSPEPAGGSPTGAPTHQPVISASL